jgi:hypothetical protein
MKQRIEAKLQEAHSARQAIIANVKAEQETIEQRIVAR